MEWSCLMLGPLSVMIITYLYLRWKYGPNIMEGVRRADNRDLMEHIRAFVEEMEKSEKDASKKK